LLNNLNEQIVKLEKELYIERTDNKNQKESKNYYKNRCIELQNELNSIPPNIRRLWYGRKI